MKWEFTELARSMINRKMLIGCLLCFGALLYGGKEIIHFRTISFIDTFIFSQTDNTTAILALIFPLLAVLPTGTAYRDEKQVGFYSILCCKVKKIRYCRIKMICALVSGAVVLGIPNLIYYLICIILKGNLENLERCVSISFFPKLYNSNPMLYGFLLVGNSALCGAVFSLLGLGVSAWIRNKYIAVIVPFAYYIFSGIALFYISPLLNAIQLFSLNQYAVCNLSAIIIYDILLIGIGIVLFVSGVYYEDSTA